MTTPIAQELADALKALQDWCHNNVAYFPDVPETEQNSGERGQPAFDLAQTIDANASAALARYEKEKNK
jgi:hypothetical protein